MTLIFRHSLRVPAACEVTMSWPRPPDLTAKVSVLIWSLKKLLALDNSSALNPGALYEGSRAVIGRNSFVDFVCLLAYLTSLVISFFPCVLTSLFSHFVENKPIPFPGRRSQKATKHGFWFLCVNFVLQYVSSRCMFAFVVFDSVFQH